MGRKVLVNLGVEGCQAYLRKVDPRLARFVEVLLIRLDGQEPLVVLLGPALDGVEQL